MIWIVAFLATVCINVTYGLIVSVLFALFVTVVRTQRAKSVELVRCGNSTTFIEKQRFKHPVNDEDNIVIAQFRGTLQFVNVEQFRDTLLEMVEQDEHSASNIVENGEKFANGDVETQTMMPPGSKVRWMVIDCTTLNDIDYSGVTLLHSVRDELIDRRVQPLFACLQRKFVE